MERFKRLIGRERSLGGVSEGLHFLVAGLRAPVVGAVHVTCADETEHECVTAFQRGFVQYFLPQLKFAHQSAFRLANLGGRYEWGAIRIAEQHFAAAGDPNREKLLVVKVNSHVALEMTDDGPSFGFMKRYGRESPCCGALSGLLTGDDQPYVGVLRELFASEGQDRVATLLDPQVVEPEHRSLFAALAAARLQARKVILDLQDYRPASPTRFLVVPCVTLNRPEKDSEIVCGIYSAHDHEQPSKIEYFGLGDDPGKYRLKLENHHLTVTDDQHGVVRLARDHRQLVRDSWRQYRGSQTQAIDDHRLNGLRREVLAKKHKHTGAAKPFLRRMLPVLFEIAPVPSAVMLFTQGLAGIHHAFRAHRLSQGLARSPEAQRILDDIPERIEHLEPEEAEAVIEYLLREY